MGMGLAAVGDRLDVSTPTVVLKFDQNVMHHGGLGVIRSLGHIGVSACGTHGGLRSRRVVTDQRESGRIDDACERASAAITRLTSIIGSGPGLGCSATARARAVTRRPGRAADRPAPGPASPLARATTPL